MQSFPQSSNTGAGDNGGPFYPPGPTQQQAQSLSAPDEMHLTAHLTQTLGPVMSSASGPNMADGPDPRSHVNVNHPYHEHEQEHDPNLHAQHMHGGHGPMDQMGLQYGSPDGSQAPKKRTKVSRACDECRRKKIRCDATGEAGEDLCSNCKRSSASCQFSRVPLKRGPSKGYIKELADRVQHLEGAIHTGDQPQHISYQSPPQRRSDEEFSPPPHADTLHKKRTHSLVSSEFNQSYQPQQPGGSWTSHEPPRHQLQSASSYPAQQPSPGISHIPFHDHIQSPNGLPPTPKWTNPPPTMRRQSSSFESAGQNDPNHAEQTPDTDLNLLDRYRSYIHPTFPLLPKQTSKLSLLLANCSPELAEAFNDALNAAVQSLSPSTSSPNTPAQAAKAARFIIQSPLESTNSRSFSANLILLQAMIFMAIEAGSYAPTQSRDQRAGPESVWLCNAVGLAHSMKLHLQKVSDRSPESDPDTDDKLARRTWLSLVIMDRWHSASAASPLTIPDSSVVLHPEDKTLLGETTYEVTRLSIILGHISELNLVSTDRPIPNILATVDNILKGELERWREGVSEAMLNPSNAPFLYTTYWFLQLLNQLRSSVAEPHSLLETAKSLVTQLVNNTSLVNPLSYHPAALVTLTLTSLSSYDGIKDEAESALQSLRGSGIPISWATALRELTTTQQPTEISKVANQPSSSSQVPDSQQHAITAANQNLQRLAHIATLHEEGNRDVTGEGRKEAEKGNPSSGSTGVGSGGSGGASSASHSQQQRDYELRDLVKGGYVNAFTGESGR